MGIMGAAATFLPVFLVRLGGGAVATGILTTLPALGGLLFGVPLGRFLQRPWPCRALVRRCRASSSRGRTPGPRSSRCSPRPSWWCRCALLWAIMALPQTLGQVTFPIVMDGAAGPQGRIDLMGRRWAIMGLGTAIAVAMARASCWTCWACPSATSWCCVTGTVAGVFSYWYSVRIVLDEGAPGATPEREHRAAAGARTCCGRSGRSWRS